MVSQRVVFSPDDFKGSGQTIVRCSYDGEDHQFGASVAYKIGYIGSGVVASAGLRSGFGQTILKISLADGMALEYASKEELCNALNNDSIGYRPLEESKLLVLVAMVGNRFESKNPIPA